MDWKYLFFSFEGRINRKPYWLTLPVFLVAYFVLTLMVYSGLGLPLKAVGDVSATSAAARLGVSLLLLYPSLAVTIKRLHDRNRSGWWAGLVYGFSLLIELIDVAGLGGSAENPSVLAIVLFFAFVPVMIWFLIEVGFLRGTQGPNRFGPDPLGATRADASF